MSRSDRQPAQNRSRALYERLAKVADLIAETSENGARIQDQLVGRRPGAADRAACQRRLAAAQAEAAVAYRNLEVPSDSVRQAIIRAGSNQAVLTAPTPTSRGPQQTNPELPPTDFTP